MFVGVFVGVVVAYFVASALLLANALLLASADSANAVATPVGLGSASSFAVLG